MLLLPQLLARLLRNSFIFVVIICRCRQICYASCIPLPHRVTLRFAVAAAVAAATVRMLLKYWFRLCQTNWICDFLMYPKMQPTAPFTHRDQSEEQEWLNKWICLCIGNCWSLFLFPSFDQVLFVCLLGQSLTISFNLFWLFGLNNFGKLRCEKSFG